VVRQGDREGRRFDSRLNAFARKIAVPGAPVALRDVHYHPAEKGVFGPGSNGTGPFELTEFTVGKGRNTKPARTIGVRPVSDTFEFSHRSRRQPGRIDFGDGLKQVDGLSEADAVQVNAMKRLPHVQQYGVLTSQTGVARMRVDHKILGDSRVPKPLEVAIDHQKVIGRRLLGRAFPRGGPSCSASFHPE